jgi:two-component sensor histidine kinase
MQVSWANASLSKTVHDAIAPYDDHGAGRFIVDGPDIAITSGAVIALSMTFNELCTNTTKFGALSISSGKVDVNWILDSETQRVRLTWTERGGPPVSPPARRSFGTRMIHSVGQQLKGQVELNYDPAGLVYTLDIPVSSL